MLCIGGMVTFLFLILVPVGSYTTKVYNAWPAQPTVAFLARQHHHALSKIRFYCLVTQAHWCEQLSQSHYTASRKSNPQLLDC